MSSPAFYLRLEVGEDGNLLAVYARSPSGRPLSPELEALAARYAENAQAAVEAASPRSRGRPVPGAEPEGKTTERVVPPGSTIADVTHGVVASARDPSP